MIRIAYVIDSIHTPSAGTENQLLMLLHGLNRQIVQPYLICLQNSEWLQSTELPVDVITYNIQSIKSIPFIKNVRKFTSFCREHHIDIIQTFFTDGNKFGVIGGRLAHVPVIIASRRNVGHGYDRKNISMLRFLQRWTTRYLANSYAALKKTMEIEGVPKGKINVIYNGLNLSKIATINYELRMAQRKKWQVADDETVIGIIANLRDVKNIDSLIRVAARLIPDYPKIRFVSVGEGPDHEKLQGLINSLDIQNKFLLAGRHTDIIPCLAAFDIGVLCSTYESFSNSLIEYMAAGLPIVASDVGGNSEAIQHGINGLLYPVQKENKLEDALRQLLRDPAFASQLGTTAKQDAFRQYSMDTCLRNHEEYYTRLIQGVGHYDKLSMEKTAQS